MKFNNNNLFIYISFIIIINIYYVNCVDHFITGTIRDFPASGDFHRSDTLPKDGAGLLENTLTNGKPVRSGATSQTISSFSSWYDSPTTNLNHMIAWTQKLSVKSTYVYKYDGNPFYPIDNVGLGNDNNNHNSYFTLEATTVFRMPATGTIHDNVKLTFGSTDDLWVYVNNQLVLDAGGLHTYSENEITMLNYASSGTLVELKIFYAHRSQSTTPRLRIEIVPPSKCSIATAGTQYGNIYPLSGTNTILTRKASLPNSNTLRLISNTDVDSGGSAWHSTPFPVRHGFKTEFNFRFTNKGASNKAEGMAFVMQSDSSTAGGLEGNNLFYNIEKSVAIEIDTSQDAWENNGNHISINTRYNLLNSPDHGQASIGGGQQIATDLDNGSLHKLTIQYEPSGGLGTIWVYLNDVLVVTANTITDNDVMDFSNGYAYFGFTASSSTNVATVEITNWKVWIVEAAASRSSIASMPSNIVASDNQNSEASALLQVYDACGTQVNQTVGDVFMELKDQSSTVVPSSTASTDYLNGSYTVYFFHTNADEYTLEVKLRNLNIYNSPFSLTIDPAPADPATSSFTTDISGNVEAQVTKVVTVTVLDRFGNARANSGDIVSGQYSNSITIYGVLNNGQWFIFIENNYAGQWNLFVRVAGQDITGGNIASPLAVTVVPGTFQGDMDLSGDGLLGGISGVSKTFQIAPYDNNKYNQIIDKNVITDQDLYVVGPGGDIATNIQWNDATNVIDASYLGTLAGSYTIYVSLNNLENTTTTISVVAGDLSTVDSSFLSISTATVGVTHQITVQARDSNSNIRSNENPQNEYFIFKITDSAGTLYTTACQPSQPVNAIQAVCTYIGGGRYALSYVPIKSAGSTTPYTVEVVDNNANILSGSSETYTVISGPLSTSTSTLEDGSSGVAGSWASTEIVSRDSNGNIRAEHDDTSSFSVSIFLTNSPQITADVQNLVDNNDGHYTIYWRGNISGDYTISAKVVGVSVLNSPRTENVVHTTTDVTKATLSGPGASGGVANTPVNLTVTDRDRYGNQRITSSDDSNSFSLVITPYTTGSIQTITPATYYLGSGRYIFTFNVPSIGTPPIYNMLLKYNTINGPKKNGTIAANAGITNATASGAGLTTATAGVPATFTIQDRDGAGNPFYDPSISFSVTIESTKATVTDINIFTENEVYVVTYTAIVADTYELKISNGAVFTNDSPYTLIVQPGTIDASKSIVTGFPNTVTAGDVFTFYIAPRDQHENNIINNALVFDLIYNPNDYAPLTPASITMLPDGKYEVNVTFTKATTELKEQTSIDHIKISVGYDGQAVGQTNYEIKVVPAAAYHEYTTVIYSYNPSDGVPEAGASSKLQLEIRDQYQNRLDKDSNLVQISLENNPNTTFSTVYVDSQLGRFISYYTPTVSNAVPLNLYIKINNQNIPSSPISLKVNPSDPEESATIVTGLAGKTFKAKKQLFFYFDVKDRFNNNWQDLDSGVEVVIVSGPTLLSNFIVTSKGNGRYEASWSFPQIASQATIDSSIDQYIFHIKITYGSPQVTKTLSTVNGLIPITIYAGDTCPERTVVPPLTSSTFVAGQSRVLEIILYDCAIPANRKIAGGETINMQFFEDGGTNQCPCPGANCNDKTSKFEYNKAIDNNDGSYNVTIESTLAGKYSMRLNMSEGDVHICENFTRFTISPDVAKGSKSLISFSPTRAGVEGLMEITLHDQYNNRIEKGGQNVNFYDNQINFPATMNCDNETFFHPIPMQKDPQTNISTGNKIIQSDHGDGIHSILYTTTTSADYTIIASVNGEYIGDSCNILVIYADSIFRFDLIPITDTTVAKKETVQVTSYDKYDNLVWTTQNQEYTYTGDFANTDTLGQSAPNGLVYGFAGQITDPYSIIKSHQISFLSAWAGDYQCTVSLDTENIPTGAGSKSVENWDMRVTPATCADYIVNTTYRCPDNSCKSKYLNCPSSGNLCNGEDKIVVDILSVNVSTISCSFAPDAYKVYFTYSHSLGSETRMDDFTNCTTIQCNDGTSCNTNGSPVITVPVMNLVDHLQGFNFQIQAFLRRWNESITGNCYDSTGAHNINFQKHQQVQFDLDNTYNNEIKTMCFTSATMEQCTTLPKYCITYKVRAITNDVAKDLSKCAIDDQCSQDCSTCPTNTIYCPNLGFCTDLSNCPSPSTSYCPLDAPVRCPGDSKLQLCRKLLEDCPTRLVCPLGLKKCPDGRSCAKTLNDCYEYRSRTCASSHRCPSGQCVESRDSCPTDITCSQNKVLCSDGSCRDHVRMCPNQYDCESSDYIQCQDGISCRLNIEDCPTAITCPIGYIKCENGECAKTLSECQVAEQCPTYLVRCADGSCMPNRYLCPSSITCSSSNPIRCADGTCVTDFSKCKEPLPCPNGMKRCTSGDCILNDKECPISSISCHPSRPVLCSDGTCVTSIVECIDHDLPECPYTSSHRCPDGTCRSNVYECEIKAICPENKPIRCNDGRCTNSPEYCPNNSSRIDCDASLVRCPTGGCAHHFTLCPTSVTCPLDTIRCPDGTCRLSCNDISKQTTVCQTDQISCPNVNTGTTCRSSIKECPQGRTCPFDTPVLCADNTCRRTSDDCPEYDQALGFSLGCDSGTYAKGLNLCGVGTTCPKNYPYKCHDESCRKSPEDCPPQPKCPTDTPYACADGSCDSSIDRCGGLVRCTDPAKPIKCPWFKFARGCVASVDECPDIATTGRNAVKYPCSNYWNNRCRDGACRSDLLLCKDLQCPYHLPHRCDNGLCTKNANECPVANGCPPTHPIRCNFNGLCMIDTNECNKFDRDPCSEGETLCPDGTCSFNAGDCYNSNRCAEGQTLCHDKTCTDFESDCISAEALANVCPPSRPYRCNNGLCAISSTTCPIIPSDNTPCRTNYPVRCADGTCAKTADQCRHLFPCDDIRCPDGSCRSDISRCPPIETATLDNNKVVGNCTNGYFRCPEGTCAKTAADCLDETTGCPLNYRKCEDSGYCVPINSLCPASERRASGCPVTKPTKCFNGQCASGESSCPRSNGCTHTKPYRCGDGTCVSSLISCTATILNCTDNKIQCPNGECVVNATQCVGLNGCNTNEIRCASGECKLYDAFSNNNNSCQATVVCDDNYPVLCADGSCQAHGSMCPSLHSCPNGQVLCNDKRTCKANINDCPIKNLCPLGSPILCNDGSCRRSIRQCHNSRFSTKNKQCSWPNGVLCADGTCQASTQVCSLRMYKFRGNIECENVECYNGYCAESSDLCPLFPRCPLDYPYLCQDGSCTKDSATCSNNYDASYQTNFCSGKTLCDDGICRTSCFDTNGCKLQQHACPTCQATCTSPTTRTSAKPCESDNCFRDILITKQTVSIVAQKTTKIDLAADNQHVARAFLTIPSGALRNDVISTFIKILPVPTQRLRNTINRVHTTRQNEFGAIMPFVESVVSSAFSCETEVSTPLVYNLLFEAYYDIPTDIPNVPKFNRSDICLAFINSNNEWQCTNPFRPSIWTDDGRPINLLSGEIDACDGKIYAFVKIPGEAPEANTLASFWERNKVALMAGLFGGIAFILVMAYTGSRLVRYRKKYDATKREMEELEDRHQQIDEFEGGLGVAGEDIIMVANPLVVQMNSVDNQLAQVQQKLGYQSKDQRQLQKLVQRKEELMAERARLQQQIMEQDTNRRPSVMQQPQLPAEGQLPTTFAISYADDNNNSNDPFGPVRMKKKF